MRLPVIVLAGGGTGGSVTPLLAIVDHIGVKKIQWRWIGTGSSPERRLVSKYDIGSAQIFAGKWRRYWSIRNLLTPFEIGIGFIQSLYWLIRWRVSAVITAGGFVAVPVAWAAALLRRPVLVIQQDVVIGLANRLILPIASKAISVIDFQFHPSYDLKKFGSFVRSQVRSGDRERIVQRLAIPLSSRIVLVIGGGTGSEFLNTVAHTLLSHLPSDVHVLHVTADRPQQPLVHSQYHPIVFESEYMGDLYAAADCVITRAGMGVLSECAACSCPVIIVPLPGTQQELNARWLEKKNAAIVIDQSALLPDLCKRVTSFLEDTLRREKMAQTLHDTLVEASEGAVYELLEQLVGQPV